MKMKKYYLLILIVILIGQILAAEQGDSFLLKILSNYEKSKIITEKGIESYQVNLQQNRDLNSISMVKEYFETALKINPENSEAKKYLDLVNSFKTRQSQVMLKSALKYFDEKKKSLQDEFNLCYFIQKSLDADPRNKEALKLKNQNRSVYKKIIEHYTNKGKEAGEKYKSEKDSKKSDTYKVQALDNYEKVLLVDPQNNQAIKEKKFYENLLTKDIQTLLKEGNDLVKNGRYKDCRLKLVKAWGYSKRMGWKMSKDIQQVEFFMNYWWAISYYKNNNLDLAADKINRALAIKRTPEAEKLGQVILGKLKTTNITASFDATLERIDDLIESDELIRAKEKIESLKKNIKNSKQIAILDSKLGIIYDKLEPLYEQAINSYNDENYNESVKIFETVLGINGQYKDAQKYYEKALLKKKALESF